MTSYCIFSFSTDAGEWEEQCPGRGGLWLLLPALLELSWYVPFTLGYCLICKQKSLFIILAVSFLQMWYPILFSVAYKLLKFFLSSSLYRLRLYDVNVPQLTVGNYTFWEASLMMKIHLTSVTYTALELGSSYCGACRLFSLWKVGLAGHWHSLHSASSESVLALVKIKTQCLLSTKYRLLSHRCGKGIVYVDSLSWGLCNLTLFPDCFLLEDYLKVLFTVSFIKAMNMGHTQFSVFLFLFPLGLLLL